MQEPTYASLVSLNVSYTPSVTTVGMHELNDISVNTRARRPPY
jgi:hypothetical protein